MDVKRCPSCGAPIEETARTCKYCGEAIPASPPPPPPAAPAYQQPPQQPYYPPQYSQPPQQQYAPQQYVHPQQVPPVPYRSGKSKIAAGLLAIFLGWIGVHKFYLGKTGLGILYLVFCWTYIPAIVGFIEGIIYLTSSDEKFEYKYVNHK